MTARCSSCRYPLTVSDSVVCHECWSYFHIDCAQLVGFPVFVLSGEPSKNTFHCSTCQLLPLPVARDDSSDTGDDEGMPSRQLDPTLEGNTDLAKEMNEMKGGIQDISDLCKDMLREINDLKSINLTLRCCVENLRHDNEQRDAVISDLKVRIDLLEGKYFGTNKADSTVSTVDRFQEEEKEAEVCTPYELECTKIKTSGNLASNLKYQQNIVDSFENTRTVIKDTSTSIESKDEVISENENEDLNPDFYLNENKQNEDTEETGYSNFKSNDEDENVSKQDLVTTKEQLKAEIVNDTKLNKQDWSWRGNEAVELEKEDNYSNEEEEESEAETEAEDKDSQSWQKLEEEDTLPKQEDEITESLSEDEFWDLQQEEKSEEKQEMGKVRKSVRWDEGIADEDSESEAEWLQKETKEVDAVDEQKNEEQSEVSETDEDSHAYEGDLEDRLDADEEIPVESSELAEKELHPETSEFAIEEESRLGIDDGTSDMQMLLGHMEGVPVSESRSEEVEREAAALGEESPHLEGEVEDNGVSRLEVAENEESRLDVPEFTVEDDAQPPESPPAVHTEEDLWLYLRDNVSSVHPSTVQEFVQNLIGTLQKVPEEYLKPVIDANIRRVKTPSVTDGEHLTAPEDEEAIKENCLANDIRPLDGGNLSSAEPQETPSSEEVFTSATEMPSRFPGGSSALEAAD